VTLPGAVAPVSIALRVTETHKLLRHDKAAVPDESDTNDLIIMHDVL